MQLEQARQCAIKNSILDNTKWYVATSDKFGFTASKIKGINTIHVFNKGQPFSLRKYPLIYKHKNKLKL